MQVLRHELNHIYLNRLNPSIKIPRWFGEGFSMYYANETFLSNTLLVNLLKEFINVKAANKTYKTSDIIAGLWLYLESLI